MKNEFVKNELFNMSLDNPKIDIIINKIFDIARKCAKEKNLFAVSVNLTNFEGGSELADAIKTKLITYYGFDVKFNKTNPDVFYMSWNGFEIKYED